MNKPLITIAMPVYNVEKYVERALLSALNQSYDNLEILVIDDKGADKSMEIVSKIMSSHPKGNNVRIIDHVVNRGTGATKNSAIDNARGEYLFFMDSDDYITSQCIELLYNAIYNNDAEMVIGSFMHFSIDSNSEYPHLCSNRTFIGEDAYEDFYNSKSYFVQTWNKLYKLSLLRENKVYCIPSNTNEDVFFSFQLLHKVRKIVCIDDITYYYAVGGINSVTYNMRKNIVDSKRIKQYIGILSAMAEMIQNKSDVPRIKYFLHVKSFLIRDIARSTNTTTEEKENYLKLIPAFEHLNNPDIIKMLPASVRKYLADNPIKVARLERISNFPINCLRKMKKFLKMLIGK